MHYNSPKYQQFNIKGVKHLDPLEAYRRISSGQAMLIDLREEEEYIEGVADVVPLAFFPISTASVWDFDISETEAIMMCAHGVRSAKVCAWLMQNGLEKVFNLDGGFEQWMRLDLPVRKVF